VYPDVCSPAVPRAVVVMTGILRVPRRAALAAISVVVAAASAASFAESYRGLYDWSHGHGLSGSWAVIWPLQVDVFVAVGELALFVALADGRERRSRTGPGRLGRRERRPRRGHGSRPARCRSPPG
jgi:hypothetical protein